MGYPIFYSDKEARWIQNNQPEVIEGIKSVFGEQSYLSHGELNRAYISEQIFNDKSKLEKINQIVHPAVRKHYLNWVANQNSPLVFNEAAILFETGSYSQYDKNILVIANESTKIKRIKKRDQINEEAVEARMKNQWSDDQKIPLADYIINNSDGQMILPQINEILADILATK